MKRTGSMDSGGDQDLLSGQVLFEGHLFEDILEQSLRLGHFSGTGVAAGEIPVGRLDDLIAKALELVEIILNDGVFEHLGIHGRGDDLVAFAGHDGGGEHIVGQAVGDLADDIGRGRGHQDHVGALGQGHMLHGVLEIPVEGVHQALVGGEGLEGDGVDEIGGVLGHQHLDIGVELLEHGCQRSDLIGGDGAGDGQNDGFIFQHWDLLLLAKCVFFTIPYKNTK